MSREAMRTCSSKSPRNGNCSGWALSAWISSVSQVRACVCNIPVPEAIERLQTERPRKRRCRYSPKESHCFTRDKVPGLGRPITGIQACARSCMDLSFIELLAQLFHCLMSACIFPEDERRERTIVGIDPHQAMPVRREKERLQVAHEHRRESHRWPVNSRGDQLPSSPARCSRPEHAERYWYSCPANWLLCCAQPGAG